MENMRWENQFMKDQDHINRYVQDPGTTYLI